MTKNTEDIYIELEDFIEDFEDCVDCAIKDNIQFIICENDTEKFILKPLETK